MNIRHPKEMEKKDKHPLLASSLPDSRRTATDLAIALAIAFLLALLSLSLNFTDDLHVLLNMYADYRIVQILVNFLFFWLCALLWMAFARWRNAVRKRIEFENILASISPDALIVVSPDRRILVANESVRRIFGYAPAEVVDRTTDLLYDDRRSMGPDSHEIYEALEQDGFHVGLANGKRRSGERVPLEIIAGDLSDSSGAVLILRDISERERQAEERRRMEQHILRADKLSSLGLLASGVAHDFNNVLMSISGHAELSLLDLPESSPVISNIKNIMQASRHAAHLCEQMMLYSGRRNLATECLDISNIIDDIMELLKISAPGNAELRCDLTPGLPLVKADATRLRQIVMNFASNAADALGGKPGVITIKTGEFVHAGSHLAANCLDEDPAPGRYVSLAVADTGHGIDPADRAKVFDPFFTTKTKGHGLGLATVMGIIRAHKGALMLESEPGRGAVFTILLPVSEGLLPEQRAAGGADSWRGHGPVILAEDNELVLGASRALLEHMGFDVTVARDGNEALSVFLDDPDKPVLVMLDIKMPNLNGIDAFREMRKIRPELPVLIASGHLDKDTLREIAQTGGVSFIYKPYELETLREQIAQLLANPHHGQDAAQ